MSTAVVFSEVNVFSLFLVESLLNQLSNVVVLTREADLWKRQTNHLRENRGFEIFDDLRSLPSSPNYVFLVQGFNSINEQSFSTFSEYVFRKPLKAVVVLPLAQLTNEQKLSQRILKKYQLLEYENLTAVYLGEQVAPRMSLSDLEPVSRMIKEAVSTGMVGLPNQEIRLCFTASPVAAREIVRAVFSFGFPDKEVVLAQFQTTSEFFKKIHSFLPGVSYYVDEQFPRTRYLQAKRVLELENGDTVLGEAIAWLKRFPLTVRELPPVKTPTNASEVKEHKPKRSWAKTSLIFFTFCFWLLCLPFISLLISGVLANNSYARFRNGDFSGSLKSLIVSSSFANFSDAGFGVLTKAPLVGKSFTFFADTAESLKALLKIAEKTLYLSERLFEGLKSSVSREEYDLEKLSEELYLIFGDLHREVSFLSKGPWGRKIRDVDSLLKYLSLARKLSPRLTTLLGYEKQKTYLVLFQNNMELRPTGGFIGSFALLTFDKGVLIDMTVNDVYSADGQLKGHVEPPKPIKDYLGEANWFLRDSNWDPDFPTSATRAEWFLEKEMERSVDGVIGVDLNFVEDLLKVVGPVKLPEFNQEINSDNLYERIQYEVQSEFFPGSIKKATILTALSGALLERIKSADAKESFEIAMAVFENLQERHVQIFVHDKDSREVIADMSMSGEVSLPVCEGNCQRLFWGVVDANLGVNKANYFLTKTYSYRADLTQGSVENRLEVKFVNKAPPALGLLGKYKSYMRLIAQPGSAFENVEIQSSQGTKSVEPEVTETQGRVEAGVLLEVQPETERNVVFVWKEPLEADFEKPGQIKLFIRKQAGVGDEALDMKISLPVAVSSATSYNTTLEKDIQKVFAWTK